MKAGARCLTQQGSLPKACKIWLLWWRMIGKVIILSDALGGAVLPRFLVRSTEDL